MQVLVPTSILDRVGYASHAYGCVDKSTNLPLSKRCMGLKQDPRRESGMQARLLSQSMFVADHSIKVITHGCGDFFSEQDPAPLSEISAKKLEQQKTFLAQSMTSKKSSSVT